jgi:hypothetical protein
LRAALCRLAGCSSAVQYDVPFFTRTGAKLHSFQAPATGRSIAQRPSSRWCEAFEYSPSCTVRARLLASR